MNMIQLNPQIAVYTPLGPGLAYFIIDYGMSVNTCWVIRLAKGEIKHFDSNDIRVEGNPTYGFPLKPELPDNWKQVNGYEEQPFFQSYLSDKEN